MNGKRPLGEFLQKRRSQMRPEDVALATYGETRRVPGLRREELALLAGVSASYYTRLEQGRSSNASPEVLEAIARALCLDEAERLHLHDLAAAQRRPVRPRRVPPEQVAASVRQLVSALTDVPVVVLGQRCDVVAWNRPGHLLFAGHLDPESPDRPADRPNMAELVFCDGHTRDLYADWQQKARDVVGTLRLAAGRHPDDPKMASLIGRLMLKSEEFESLWGDHRVRACPVAVYTMRHPLVGSIEVTQQTLQAELDQRVVMVTAAPDSASAHALALLARTIHSGRDDSWAAQPAAHDQAVRSES
ncbi:MULTISPECIES: helix-turn-helix domain-containing protein [unclassified Streptomyces]|uniref:helix-turn-helix domain-containing protein n=1 Tax=unclassified Streptomyces TaxID=2593676 RepID=UPI00382524FB